MIEAIALAVLAAKIKKYNVKLIFKDWAVYPILFFSLVFVVLQAMFFCKNYSLLQYVGILRTLYLMTFIIPVIKYKQYISAIAASVFTLAGSWLNNMCIAANGGKMPVFPSLSYATGFIKYGTDLSIDELHILGNETTKLKILSDIFDLGYNILSLGDILIMAYAYVIIYYSIKHLNRVSAMELAVKA